MVTLWPCHEVAVGFKQRFSDVIGFALLAAALLLLVAQFSFDRYDLSFVSASNASHHQTHNWIGPLGANVPTPFFSFSASPPMFFHF